MKTQFITDEQGKRTAVILPIKQYERMIENIEELEDIRLYDEVKARQETSINFEDYLKQRKTRKDT